MTDYPVTPDTTDDEEERRRKGLLWLWFAVIVVLLAGLLALIERLDACGDTCGSAAGSGNTLAGGGTFPPGGGSQSATSTIPEGAGASSVSIRVTGSERGGLAPGMTSPVVIKIANAGSAPERITSAGVVVGDASSSCTAAESIRASHYDSSNPGAPSYEVAPGKVVKIPLTISMLDLPINQNSCKNASFPLTFHATAQQG